MFRDRDLFLVEFVKSITCDSTETGLYHRSFLMILRTPIGSSSSEDISCDL